MARLSQDFIERTQELQGTVAARASGRVTAWALRSAAHTGDDHFDALARRVTSSPTRLAGLMSGDHDPMLLCALAGRRSMQDLAGVPPAGGRSQAAPTVLESCAARRVQEHWELCRTEPEKAKRLEARWAAGRATMRSGYMGAPLAAMEATFGAACSAEREAAQGRLVSTVPPASWNPAGAHAGRLAGYGSARWNRMRAEAVAETEAPADWRPRRGNDAADRPRARFVARGAGRSQQLADSRFSPRMAVSRIAFQYRLKRAMARGPAATRRFLTSVASNPRRAAAAVRARLDPMVVAAALGPKAIEGMLAGKPVTGAGTARPAAGRVAQAGRRRVWRMSGRCGRMRRRGTRRMRLRSGMRSTAAWRRTRGCGMRAPASLTRCGAGTLAWAGRAPVGVRTARWASSSNRGILPAAPTTRGGQGARRWSRAPAPSSCSSSSGWIAGRTWMRRRAPWRRSACASALRSWAAPRPGTGYVVRSSSKGMPPPASSRSRRCASSVRTSPPYGGRRRGTVRAGMPTGWKVRRTGGPAPCRLFRTVPFLSPLQPPIGGGMRFPSVGRSCRTPGAAVLVLGLRLAVPFLTSVSCRPRRSSPTGTRTRRIGCGRSFRISLEILPMWRRPELTLTGRFVPTVRGSTRRPRLPTLRQLNQGSS